LDSKPLSVLEALAIAASNESMSARCARIESLLTGVGWISRHEISDFSIYQSHSLSSGADNGAAYDNF
jgi:hypothetical protein